jgi:hypothetical protein
MSRMMADNKEEVRTMADLSGAMGVEDSAGPNRWLIDDDSTNPGNVRTGYCTYQVIMEVAAGLAKGPLAFYGTSVGIQYPSETSGKNAFTTETWGATKISQDASLGPDTTCPNTYKLSTNHDNSTPWPHMLRAPKPPTPPSCRPSPYGNCPSDDGGVNLAAKKKLQAG